jgi:hypothetical protein
VTKQVIDGNPDFFSINPMDFRRFLVISIGTGSEKKETHDADKAAKWGSLFGWLNQGHSAPLVDVFQQASADMVDYHISVVFQALNFKNYIRPHSSKLEKKPRLLFEWRPAVKISLII